MLRYVFWGLMAIAMASVASADHKTGHASPGGGGSPITLGDLSCTANQIAKFNGVSGAWECAFDEVGGDSFVVVDSNDQIIRHTTIDDNLRSAFVAVDVQFLAETVTVVHELEQDEIILNRTINYESSDCSDQPYIFARDGGVIIGGGSTSPSPPPPPPPPSPPQLSMLPNFKESAIIIDPFAAGGPNSDARLIFFLDYNQLIFIAPLSILDDAGNCITQNYSPQWAFPVTEVQLSDFRDDFHALFPPPYRILLR